MSAIEPYREGNIKHFCELLGTSMDELKKKILSIIALLAILLVGFLYLVSF